MSDKWQPIETAPRDGTQFLVWDVSEMYFAWFQHGELHFIERGAHEFPFVDSRDFEHYDAIAPNSYAKSANLKNVLWMPLPKPPQSPNQ